MAQRYRVSSTHPEDIACGQMVAPGETTSRVNPKHPHDKRLIDEGRLIAAPVKRQPPKRKESK